MPNERHTEAISRVGAAYRGAITKADRLLRKLNRATLRGDAPTVEALERELRDYEARIEAARRTVEAHTRATLARPMRTRVKPTAVSFGQRSA